MTRVIFIAKRRNQVPGHTLIALVLALLVGAESTLAQDESPVESHRITWLHSMEEATELARTRRTPILVIFGAVWCGPCRMLEKEIEDPAVQKELERWVPVHLDVDEDPDTAAEMAAAAIPAMRVLTPDGRMVGNQDGFMEADALAGWLEEQFAAAMQETTSEKVAAKLTNASVRKVLKDFRSRESTVREAAISRLVAVPELAAAHVVTEFMEASLSERLAYLELLSAWEAPVDGLDPWIPTTLTTERLTDLEVWLRNKEFPKSGDSSELSASELIDVKRLLRLLLTADASEGAAYREQLARMGTSVLPLLREAMNEDLDDESRARLSMARYRIAASGELVSNWPGGVERLASPEFNKRVAAVHELSSLVTSADESLLSELVADPAPLIREISLGALKRIGGGRVDGPLVKMLSDPDPNVRAAVLMHLADAKSATLVPAIAEYISKESDVDLVVHAVRCLREIPDATSKEALLPLLDHASWRVRAEAVEGLSKYLKESSRSGSPTAAAKSMGQSVSTQFLKRLDDEDGFVVGKVMEGLDLIATSGDEPQKVLLDTLDRAVNRHPGLANVIFRTASSRGWQSHDYNATVRTYCSHAVPMIRAAAIRQIVASVHENAFPEAQAGLKDAEASVRIAALTAIGKEIRRQILASVTAEIRELTKKAGQEIAAAEAQQPAAAAAVGETAESGKIDTNAEAPAAASFEPSFLNKITALLLDADERGNDLIAPPEVSFVSGPASTIAVPDDSQYTAEQSDAAFQKLITDRKLAESIYELESSLKQHFQSGDDAEQLAAAKCLAMLGHDDALTFVMEAAVQRAHLESLAELLPVLPWASRQQLFHVLLIGARSAEDRATVAASLAKNGDPRSTTEIWQLLSSDNMTFGETTLLFVPLRSSYPTGDKYSVSDVNAISKAAMIRDAREKATAGAKWQRLGGLMLLSWCQSEDVPGVAIDSISEPTLPVELRAAAVQFRLAAMSKEDAEEEAISLLVNPEPLISGKALRYLSLGSSGVISIGSEFYIHSSQPQVRIYAGDDAAPVVLNTPDGLTVDQVIPFLKVSDVNVAVCAAHLLALMKDPQGLPLLIDHWRAEPSDFSSQKLLFQAITATNDPQYVSLLEEMYFRMSKSEYAPSMADFYWTIRNMTGSEVIALRKKIRDEQGADKLKTSFYY